MPIGSGVGLGHAQGSISISTAGVERVGPVTRQVGIEAERNLGRVSTGATKVQNSFQGLSNSVRQWAGVMGVSLGAAGMVRLLQSSVAAASDLTEAMSKVGVAFADSGGEILAWSENSATALGQSRHQALEAASSFGLLFSTMGLATEESAEMSMALVQLATDIASINNISIEQALLALRSGLVGEVEPLRRVGVLLNAATIEAKALEMGLAGTTKEVTEQDKVMARYQLILEQTTLTQGDFARTSGDLANQQRIAQAASKDAQAAFGEIIQKDVIEATNMWTNALIKLTAWIKNAREAASGESLGTALLQMGGWQLPAEKDTKALNKELAQAEHMLANAERGLVSLQASAAAGLVDSAQVQAQIALVAQLTAEVNRLGGAVADVGRGGSRGPNLASVSGTVARLTGGGGVSGGFAKQAELDAAQVDYWKGIQAIDAQAHSAIQSATEQYGQQRASTVAAHEKSMAREAEDFGRQRARAVAQHERMIADIRQDAALREMTAISDLAERIAGLRLDAERRLADATQDFNERRAQQQADYEKRIAGLREDGLSRITKIEEDGQRARERALRAHRDTLLNAASRLDARAVAQEMRRFATANAEQERSQAQALKEAKENLAERLEQEKENHEERMAADQAAFDKRNAREARDLQRRIDAEQAAHEKRLADARAADDKRIADAQEAFAEQIAQEDEDRAIRLARQRQDHADQLAEMARAQALRIQQIGEQQAEQRRKLADEFKDQLEDLGLFNRARLTEQARFKRAATTLWNDMWGDWYTTMTDMRKAEREFAAQMGPHPQPLDYPSLTDPSSLPGGYNPAASTRTVNLSAGAIVVNEATRPGETAEEVLRIFERLAN